MKKQNTQTLAKAALIAAAYFALTKLSEVLGIGFGAVQFRLSEVLTVLPVFTPAAIPGLTLGCAIANLSSPFGPVDVVVGTLATLLQSLCTRRLRNFRQKDIPFASLVMPVLFNAVFVGAEIAFLSVGTDGFFTVFFTNALSVGLGEAVVCFALGLPFLRLIEKREELRKIIQQ